MNAPVTKPNKIILILALGLILFITWRVLVIGMSEYYVEKVLSGDTGAIKSALQWNANHPRAQYLQALQLIESDPARAEELLRSSILSNPTDPLAMQVMAELKLAAGDQQTANKLIVESSRLAPADTTVRTQAGAYWARTGQWEQAIAEWRDALTTSPSLGSQIFPVLLQLKFIKLLKTGLRHKNFTTNFQYCG